MAYKIGDEGPYPHLPDEYCGNCSRAMYENGAGPAGMFWDKRAGRPRSSEAMTTEQLEADDVVGLYLTLPLSIGHLQKIRENVREVPTPPELTEPVASTGATDEGP